jgi:hypothetical protein
MADLQISPITYFIHCYRRKRKELNCSMVHVKIYNNSEDGDNDL